MSQSAEVAKPRTARRALPPLAPPPPLCEGWIEKYALCRGMFASKGWHRRYAFATHEGLGLCHSNPRSKSGSCVPGRPLRPSHAKTFVPFVRRRHGEVEMQPVYMIDDVSAARHPAVPQQGHNGICSETMSSAEGGSTHTAAAAASSSTNGSGGGMYYYFGLTFEEHHKRYLLLLRTPSPQEYIKWTTYLPLYVHEGSATRMVPLGHPLEAGRPQPTDVNHRRLTEKRETTLPSAISFHLDPDPCSAEEYTKIRRTCLNWDEGERGRVFASAAARVRSLCGQSESAASESIAEVQDQSAEEYGMAVSSLFEELSPAMPEYESQRSPHNHDNNGPVHNGAGGGGRGAGAAAYPRAVHVDAADRAAHDVALEAAVTKAPLNQRLLPVLLTGTGDGAAKDAYKHPRLENADAAAFSDPSMHGRGTL
ncbi:hypothetical protein NESM_000090700 [Novymonas esmeraldas]|uniref:PH domain-containing protein n=1 Tax=Novymonas esmeraldas TaxID=1808958 RepID=A0AAW0F5C2_9TRYP